jgi:hypothetical protein
MIPFGCKSVGHFVFVRNNSEIFPQVCGNIIGCTVCIQDLGNINFEHPALSIYIDKLVTDDIISIRLCQMCSHQATCPRISGWEYANNRLQYTKHSMANNTLDKFHALLTIVTFYGRHVLEGCA